MTRAAPTDPRLHLRWGAATHVGLVRTQNQDAFRTRAPVFVVADGLGGHAGGETASHIATAALAELAAAGDVTVDGVRAAAARACARMRADVVVHPERFAMATTMSAAIVVGSDDRPAIFVAHVGDSRLYRLRHGLLTQLTVDHTELQELIAEGLVDPRRAARYPRRHVVTRALSAESGPGSTPDVTTVDLAAGDRYLLCTDGLHGCVSRSDIGGLLAAEHDPQRAADCLVAAALATGGHDNVTVVVVDI